MPDMHQYFSWHKLYSQLHFPFLGENREKESAVDAMNRQAEDQGQVGEGVGRRYDCAQRHLDTRPWGEDNSRPDRNDAIGDRSGA